MNINAAAEKDIQVIQQIAYNTWPDTFKKILSKDQIDYMLEMMYSTDSIKNQMNEQGHNYLILTEEGKGIGYTSYQLHYKPGITKIHKIYVLPYIQGKGVGKLLINEVEKIAKKNKDQFLTLNVNRDNKAVQFYEYIGFHKDSVEDIDIGNGFLMEDYVMVKHLI